MTLEFWQLAYLTFSLGVLFRLRGGGIIETGSNTLVRLIWAIGLIYACIFLLPALMTVKFVAAMIFATFASLILVPHAFAMGGGLYSPYSYAKNTLWTHCWPGNWRRRPTQTEWDRWSRSKREVYDALGMASVGFVRGLMIFGALVFCGLGIPAAATGVGAITAVHAIAYSIGWRIPLHIPPIAEKNSSDWGEVLIGMGWGLSLIAALH